MSALDRLADACGIVGEYQDIWGHTHRASAETKRALLAAMGLDPTSEQSLATALVAREEAPWRRMLEPVQVVREGIAPRIEIVLPEGSLGTQLHWSLSHEDGRRDEGEVAAKAQPVLERRSLGDGVRVRLALELPARPGLGYHRLELRAGDGSREPSAALRLIVAPTRCHEPDAFRMQPRPWGLSVQLYALRSARSWGIGDLGDLTMLIETAGSVGADLVGLNPLHALFPARPAHASPYSPSSRVFRNPLYICLEAVPEFGECEVARRHLRDPALRERIAALERSELVDHAEVARLKLPLLERLYHHFREHHLAHDTPRGREFAAFCERGGAELEAHGVFEALAEHLRGGWPAWPERYRAPTGPAVAEFAAAHRERVELHLFLQWETERQLESASRRAAEAGLRIGLYQDLAVSVDGGGFEAWWNQEVYALGARVGCPPDEFNGRGQDWGLPPWVGDRLREAEYRPFVACLRANMRHAGALRIDHVMGLMRTFWVPPGLPPTEGAYVRYPFHDLLGVLALESVRNRCLVVGEDLGTVPDEVRDALRPLGVLSYRLFYFMRGDTGDFTPPAQLPEQSLVAITTHDLPTLAGFWEGRDLTLRAELGLFPEGTSTDELFARRARDREQLVALLVKEGLLLAGRTAELVAQAHIPREVIVALHASVARSPSRILMVQLEDVLGQLDQANLPGTIDSHPNWRRRLGASLDEVAGDPRLREIASAIRREREPK